MEQKINNSSSKGGGREGAILSDRLNRLAPSATLAMSQRSSELKAQGVDVINMSVGEPDFNTPDHIKAAAIKAVEDNWSRYSPVPGYPELKKAIANKLKNENGLDYAPSQILCSNGAKQSVCNTIMALVNAGDEVIIPAPYWVSYPQMVLLAEGTPVFVEATIEQDFKITPAQLEAAITPKTRALILCSPSNPTGSVYSKAELEALKNVLLKYPNIIVVADEIYEHINYVGEHASMAQFPDIKERVVIINGVSKAYAMTGWRIGFAVGPKAIISNMTKMQENVAACAPLPSQYAGIEALSGREDYSKDMIDVFTERRNLLYDGLKDLPLLKCLLPEATFYMMVDVSQTGMRSIDFANSLLEKAHVAVVPGVAYGESCDNYIRIAFTIDKNRIIEGIHRITDFVHSLA